jgi:hypothetical protein
LTVRTGDDNKGGQALGSSSNFSAVPRRQRGTNGGGAQLLVRRSQSVARVPSTTSATARSWSFPRPLRFERRLPQLLRIVVGVPIRQALRLVIVMVL